MRSKALVGIDAFGCVLVRGPETNFEFDLRPEAPIHPVAPEVLSVSNMLIRGKGEVSAE